MMLPQQMEAVAQARREHWETEIKVQELLAVLPKRTPRWRRWLGQALFALGAMLMRSGAWVAHPNQDERIFAN